MSQTTLRDPSRGARGASAVPRALAIAALLTACMPVRTARAEGRKSEPLVPRVDQAMLVPLAPETRSSPSPLRAVDFDALVGRVLAPRVSMKSFSIAPKVFGWFSGFGLDVRGTL